MSSVAKISGEQFEKSLLTTLAFMTVPNSPLPLSATRTPVPEKQSISLCMIFPFFVVAASLYAQNMTPIPMVLLMVLLDMLMLLSSVDASVIGVKIVG